MNAIRVGAVVALFGILLAGAYVVLGRSFFAPKVNRYFAIFQDANGVTQGSKVMLAGVPVGYVEKVALEPPVRARLTLAVYDHVSIPAGTHTELPTSLIGLGDQVVLLVPPAGRVTKYLVPGAFMDGVRSSPLQKLLPDTGPALRELSATLSATRKLLQDDKLKSQVAGLLEASQQTMQRFAALAANLDATVRVNSRQLTALLERGNQVVANMSRASASIARIVSDGKLEAKMNGLLSNLDLAVSDGRKLLGQMEALVNDPNLRGSLNEIMANTKQITESGTRVAANAEQMATNGVALSEKANVFMDKANALADDVKGILQKVRSTIGSLPGMAGLAVGFEARADVFRETDPIRWRTDFNVLFGVGKQKAMVGLYDAFESNKLNLQLLHQFSPSGTLRYGVYASKPGVGVDYALSSRLGLRGDLFSANDPRLDIRLSYEMRRGLYGYLGIDRVFGRNSPTIGIGLRK